VRILKVTPGYPPFFQQGGPVEKVRALAEGLARRSHSVTVLTTWLDKPYRAEHNHQDGVEVIYLRPLARYRATTLNAGVLSFCKTRLKEFDIAHIYGLYDLMGPVVAHYCFHGGVPYILEPLGMMRPIDRNFLMKRAWHRVFGAPMVRYARRLIATSRQEEGELLKEGVPPERVALRYNGVDLEAFVRLPARGLFRSKFGIPADEPIILFLSRLIPRKGLDLLIPAFAAACPQRGRLVIAGPEGESGYVETMRKLARTTGVESRTIFTGPLYREDKKAAMVDADVFTLPSQYENFANVVAEAIACGTPVLISDRCGISEFVAGQAGLVVPREPGALAEGLGQLIGDACLRRRLRDGCPGVAARLNWPEWVGVQENLYKQARDNTGAATSFALK
jgi:glycosyltransferase involved in cell wall biosynthesis